MLMWVENEQLVARQYVRVVGNLQWVQSVQSNISVDDVADMVACTESKTELPSAPLVSFF